MTWSTIIAYKYGYTHCPIMIASNFQQLMPRLIWLWFILLIGYQNVCCQKHVGAVIGWKRKYFRYLRNAHTGTYLSFGLFMQNLIHWHYFVGDALWGAGYIFFYRVNESFIFILMYIVEFIEKEFICELQK